MDNDGTCIKIPGFSIVEGPLGGGMALVYIAQQDHTRRRVAIKVIQPRLHSTDNMAQYAARFRREAVFQANLQSPHIATLYEFGVIDDRPFIVMEYLPGGDLDQRIRDAATSPYTLEDALRILRQVALALQAAHEKGIIHRDVKPANILFRANGDAVLTDFGIAKATHDATLINEGITHTISEFALGTPRYMSPEQLRATQDSTIGSASDLYSLGATFFHMLTGWPPFQASSYMALAELHFTAPVPRLPKPLSPLDEIIQKTMAKLPEDRFPSAAALIARLDALERQWRSRKPTFLQQPLAVAAVEPVNRDVPTRVDTAKLAHSLRDDRFRRRALWAGIAATVVMAAGVATVFRSSDTPPVRAPEVSHARLPVERAPMASPVAAPPAGIAAADQPPPLSSLELPAGARLPAPLPDRLPPPAAGVSRKINREVDTRPVSHAQPLPAAVVNTVPPTRDAKAAQAKTASITRTIPDAPRLTESPATVVVPSPTGESRQVSRSPAAPETVSFDTPGQRPSPVLPIATPVGAPVAIDPAAAPERETRPAEKKRERAKPLAAPIVF